MLLLAKLIGPPSWPLLGMLIAGVALLVVRMRTPESRLVAGKTVSAVAVTIAVAGALIGIGLFVLASVLRSAWLSAGDTSPQRIASVYVWDPLRRPWIFDAHPRGGMAGSPRAGFDEVRIFGVDPNPPTVFIARRGNRWYAIERENAP